MYQKLFSNTQTSFIVFESNSFGDSVLQVQELLRQMLVLEEEDSRELDQPPWWKEVQVQLCKAQLCPFCHV